MDYRSVCFGLIVAIRGELSSCFQDLDSARCWVSGLHSRGLGYKVLFGLRV